MPVSTFLPLARPPASAHRRQVSSTSTMPASRSGPRRPAPTAADAAWPTRSGRSRSRASASGSAPRSRLTANSQQASRLRVRSKIVPAVTELRPPHPEHLKRRIAQPPATIVAAVRASEASGPSQPLQVVQTVRIGAEPGLELAHGPRIVRASTRVIHRLSLHSVRLNGYPRPALFAIRMCS